MNFQNPDKHFAGYITETYKPNGGSVTVPLFAPFPIDGTKIPTRPWIVPGLLLRRHVSVLVAPPGVGKSLLTLQMALMLGLGQLWSGWKPRGAAKTLIINSEDDADEMRRRLFAANQVMGYGDNDLLRENIRLAYDPQDIIIARADSKTKTVLRTPAVESIIDTLNDGKFDVLIVDPFAETFEGDENSNSELKWAAVLWREIARRTNCAVLLVHHTRKYANEPGSMDMARGGGALLGVARVVSTLFNMTEAEARAFDIDPEQRHEYLRFDDAKANQSLITFKARWFFKRTYTIPNGGDDRIPDDVGVLEPWDAPNLFDRLDEATAREILLTIDFGCTNDDGSPNGDLFKLTKRGGAKRWAGEVVQHFLGGEDKCSDKNAQKILDQWHANGVVQEIDAVMTSGKGKPRKGLKVHMARLPGTIIEEKTL